MVLRGKIFLKILKTCGDQTKSKHHPADKGKGVVMLFFLMQSYFSPLVFSLFNATCFKQAVDSEVRLSEG